MGGGRVGKRVKLPEQGSRRKAAVSDAGCGNATSACLLGAHCMPGLCCYWTAGVQAGLEKYSWNWLASGGTEDSEAPEFGCCLK